MGLNGNVYALIEEDSNKANILISQIITKIFPQERRNVFNIINIYPDTDLEYIKATLYNVTFGEKVLVIFRHIDLYKRELRDFIFENLSNIRKHNHILFYIEKDLNSFTQQASSDKLLTYILKQVKRGSTYNRKPLSNLVRYIKSNNTSLALNELDKILRETEPRQENRILGYLWKSLPEERFFEYFLEADRLIKEKGIDFKLALVLLVIKLCQS